MLALVDRHSVRVIPAYTGKPPPGRCGRTRRRDYPRIRGEALAGHFDLQLAGGLSPHTRGSPGAAAQLLSGRGIIPAYAGKPSTRFPPAPVSGDYPRIRGEARGALRLRPDCAGIIPAYAGKPSLSRRASIRRWDYPRIRGGAGHGSVLLVENEGLSPHTRGSPVNTTPRILVLRIIPAYAGEPYWAVSASPRSWDYPRIRGGALLGGLGIAAFLGLSPHTRGSLRYRRVRPVLPRIIPAYAGEPLGIK